jgi:hypothetical protein
VVVVVLFLSVLTGFLGSGDMVTVTSFDDLILDPSVAFRRCDALLTLIWRRVFVDDDDLCSSETKFKSEFGFFFEAC